VIAAGAVAGRIQIRGAANLVETIRAPAIAIAVSEGSQASSPHDPIRQRNEKLDGIRPRHSSEKCGVILLHNSQELISELISGTRMYKTGLIGAIAFARIGTMPVGRTHLLASIRTQPLEAAQHSASVLRGTTRGIEMKPASRIERPRRSVHPIGCIEMLRAYTMRRDAIRKSQIGMTSEIRQRQTSRAGIRAATIGVSAPA
jgi:hypothetical protein